MSIFSLLAARSVSIFETPACGKRFFRFAQRQVLVQQLRVVAVAIPARPPRLVEPEPESVRMNLLAHSYSLLADAFVAPDRALAFFARLLGLRPAAAFGAPAPPAAGC